MAALPAERGTCAKPRSAAKDDKVKSTRLFSSGAVCGGRSSQRQCPAGSPAATLTAQYTPPLNLLLQWHRGFSLCPVLCSVHTPTTTEVHIWTDRNSHTLEGCRGCVSLLAPVCLPRSKHHWNCKARRAVRYGLLDGVGWACAWQQAQPFDKTSELCYFVLELYLDYVLILNTLKRLSNTNMDQITNCPLKSTQPPHHRSKMEN